MQLILDQLPPVHWAVAGAAIGAITLLLKGLANTNLGISTGFDNLCGWLSDRPYFHRAELRGGGNWRLYFLGGLVLGGVISAGLDGDWQVTWNLGMFDAAIGGGPVLKLAWMFVGGLFIGFGTRLAGGCTSGHGIFGVSSFERASWVAMISFMAAGVVVTNIVYRVVWSGGLP